MISVKVSEATEDYPIKTVFFEDSDIGRARSIFIPSKIMYLDKHGNFICEEVVIINRINRIFRMSIYAGDWYDLVAYSEHTSDKNTTCAVNYILNNGDFKVMSSSLTEYKENPFGLKVSNFDMNGQLLFYNLLDCQHNTSKYYDRNHNEIISFGDFLYEYGGIYKTIANITSELKNIAIEKYKDN